MDSGSSAPGSRRSAEFTFFRAFFLSVKALLVERNLSYLLAREMTIIRVSGYSWGQHISCRWLPGLLVALIGSESRDDKRNSLEDDDLWSFHFISIFPP